MRTTAKDADCPVTVHTKNTKAGWVIVLLEPVVHVAADLSSMRGAVTVDMIDGQKLAVVLTGRDREWMSCLTVMATSQKALASWCFADGPTEACA